MKKVDGYNVPEYIDALQPIKKLDLPPMVTGTRGTLELLLDAISTLNTVIDRLNDLERRYAGHRHEHHGAGSELGPNNHWLTDPPTTKPGEEESDDNS